MGDFCLAIRLSFCEFINSDGLAKTRKRLFSVMPAHAGIQ
jgi:hypothetical protein